MKVELSQLEGAFEIVDGVSRPQWHIIHDWVQTHVPKSELDSAWREIAKIWLLRLAGDFSGYSVAESPRVLYLSAFAESEINAIAKHSEHALRSIEAMLPSVVVQDGCGPRVILLFNDQEHYVTYTDYYHEDGHYAASAGMFLRDGYRHIAISATADWYILESITHELAHACLSCIHLPLWLEEGVVDFLTETLHPRIRTPMTGELRNRHLRYWSRHGLGEFWSGHSFMSPKGQELSYSLAKVLVDNLLSDHRRQFQSFLSAADAADHGAKAMQNHLQMTLSQCAETFLGPGNWEPVQGSTDPIPRPHVWP